MCFGSKNLGLVRKQTFISHAALWSFDDMNVDYRESVERIVLAKDKAMESKTRSPTSLSSYRYTIYSQ